VPITDLQAYTDLSAHPRTFLKKYPLWIQGAATTATGPRNFELTDAAAYLNAPVHRPGSILKTHSMKVTQGFIVAPFGTGFGGHQFPASWLAMSEWTNSNQLHSISILTLDHTGPAVMITANLTGCAIAMQDLGGGSVAVAHIRPNSDMLNPPVGALDGAGIHNVLNKSGWTAVYGRNDYSATRQVVVVGVRRAGHWKLYAQKQTLPGAGAGDILSVHRIFG